MGGLLLLGLVFSVLYMVNDNGAAMEIDICNRYTTESQCLGQELPAQWKQWADARTRDQSAKFENLLTTDGWQCEWVDSVSMASNPCVRTNCNLDDRLEGRKLAIIYEFIGL